MIIKLAKFGQLLISRPAGREAFLSAKAYVFKEKLDVIELDFDNIKVLTPSWIGEFVNLIKEEYPSTKLVFRKSDNKTVLASLGILKFSASSS